MPRKLTKEEFIEKAKNIHGNKYNYSKIEYKNLQTKIIINCPKHGDFEQIPHKHIYRQQGCPKCGIISRAEKRNLGKNEFIKRSIKVHGNKYNYSKIEYKNKIEKVCIICPEHGEFWQVPENHYRLKAGCPICAGNGKFTFKNFQEIANKIHNNKYSYDKNTFKNMYDKIIINCPKHGDFEQAVYHHIYEKNGCPICAGSNAQNEISEFIENLGFKVIKNSRSIIPPQELDIFIPNKNIAIEYDGLYWHSEQILSKRVEDPKKYHLIKSEKCKENGIRLIHIFEDEWLYKENIVKNRLKHILGENVKTIGARKTNIIEINSKEKNKFLIEHHIQGTDKSLIKLGAYFNNELIGVMTFCKPRISLGAKEFNNEDFELSRFATKFEYSFPGLGNKMFSFFTKNYQFTKIYTYSDKRWNTGNIYGQLGMEYSHSSHPNYFYVINGERIHRFKFRKQELPNLLENFDSNLTEYQNMLKNGYDRIWDCGNDKWDLNK